MSLVCYEKSKKLQEKLNMVNNFFADIVSHAENGHEELNILWLLNEINHIEVMSNE